MTNKGTSSFSSQWWIQGVGGAPPPKKNSEFLEIMAKIINFTRYFGVKSKKKNAYVQNYCAGSTAEVDHDQNFVCTTFDKYATSKERMDGDLI